MIALSIYGSLEVDLVLGICPQPFAVDAEEGRNNTACKRNEGEQAVSPAPSKAIVHVQGEERQGASENGTGECDGGHIGSSVDHVVGNRREDDGEPKVHEECSQQGDGPLDVVFHGPTIDEESGGDEGRREDSEGWPIFSLGRSRSFFCARYFMILSEVML